MPAPRLAGVPTRRLRVLYVTDPSYVARGRQYADEDRWLASRLADVFDVRTCRPTEATDLMDDADVVVVRNSGPVLGYPEEYARFRERALVTGRPVYNELTGKADMLGKQYLLDLAAAGYPVVPSVGGVRDLDLLPVAERYVVKPLLGADSAGLYLATAEELAARPPDASLIQPLLDIAYEVSFYFVDDRLVYALSTPDPTQRWELEPYDAGEDDVAFARRFVAWNDIRHGIQRVDACRTTTGELLLLELEDLNPFLSLDRTTPDAREELVEAFVAGIRRLAPEPAAHG